jgi:hypothetical protein
VYVLADAASYLRRGVQGSGRPRMIGLQVPGGVAFEIDLDVPPTTEFGVLAPYEWSPDGRYLYVPGEAGLLVVDALTRTVATRVEPEIAHGCDLALDPVLRRLFLTDYGGILSVLALD